MNHCLLCFPVDQSCSGQMNAGERDLVLQEFKLNTERTSLLSNPRCLGEGVDITEIYGILFIGHRRSKIDTVQAVGCAIGMNDAEKIVTKVILVVLFYESGAKCEEQLSQIVLSLFGESSTDRKRTMIT